MSLDIEELLAREEIRDVMRRYVRGVDRYDLDAIRSCYHADATDERGPYQGDVDGFIAYLDSDRGLRMFSRTTHSVTDHAVAVDGDSATCESVTIAHHRLPEEHYLVGLRYLDLFARRDGEWRIARRKVAYDWAIRRPVADSDELPAHFPLGQRGPDDAVFTHLLARFFSPAGPDGSPGSGPRDPSAP
jgi:ketosteroid isomerase-like protein